MVIKNIETGKIYYKTNGDKEYFCTPEFWEALEAGEIYYSWGGQEKTKENVIFYSERLVLDLKDKAFEKKFEGIVKSEVGKLVMSGQLPTSTIL